VLVALIVTETHSAAVARWYGRTRAELVSAAQDAWQRFGRLVTNDLALLLPVAANFHRAAAFALDAPAALRAGDALHLACAEQAGARSMATLDAVLGRNAQRLKIKPVVFS
jgi:predicted nucleic acid-binding protein